MLCGHSNSINSSPDSVPHPTSLKASFLFVAYAAEMDASWQTHSHNSGRSSFARGHHSTLMVVAES